MPYSYSLLRIVVVTCLIAAGFTRVTNAQDPEVFERVLVPLSVSLVPGAYGSLWSMELWYRNNSDRPVMVFPLAASDPVPTIGLTVRLRIPVRPADTPGVILYVSRDGGDQTQFDLRLFNRADPQAAWGVKVPVVRESEFVHALNLINVPTSADFRSALRIYSLGDGSTGDETVRVQLFANDNRLLAETEIPFNGTPRYAAILSLADAFPEIRHEERVWVHVEPTSSGRKVWAFIGVTSNSTQQVALVTPD